MGITYYSGAILVVFITLTFTTTINGADVNCTQFITSLECCEKGPSNCSWVDDCKDKNNNKTVAGCFNSTLLNTTCPAYTNLTQCSTVPQVNCTTFLNEAECCKHVDHGCMYANCTSTTSGSKKFIGCFNSTDVTCSPKVDQCTVTTTSSSTSTTTTPTTTTTKSSTTTPAPTLPVPPAKECEAYNASVCCTQKIYQCIWVNCNSTENKNLTGCFSAVQEPDYQKSCKPGTYWNYCITKTTTPAATTTPKPASTTAAHVQPPDSERHFDGASFIGGIVLCAGIVLLIFFGIKFYRSRKAGNDYHHM